jgi:cytochrome P450
MIDFSSEELRRNPFPVYEVIRRQSPVLQVPPPFDAWMIFDFENVWRSVSDHDAFSSQVPAPKNWFIFFDPPRHTKLRALIMSAFTPRVVAKLEPRIREFSRQLLAPIVARGQTDLALDYSIPLPMRVIAEMIGVPADDWPTFKNWSDSILKISYSRSGDDLKEKTLKEFMTVTAEMDVYLKAMIERRGGEDNLLNRLVSAEVEGERLKHEEILGFVQLLIVGGQETTTNLINNAILCFLEHPDQLALLRASPQLLPSAIEEVLRYRSPLQWVMRTPRRDVSIGGQTIPAGKLVLPVLGAANRDPARFPNAHRFDIRRDPNPHIAFGHGIHACLGAPLSRLEARIAIADLLAAAKSFERASAEPWEPRRALNVHGPAHLPIRLV